MHPESFFEEVAAIADWGFDVSLIKVAPNCHIVTDEHIQTDREKLAAKLGTTAKGIAPVYASKAARTGVLAKDVLPSEWIWNREENPLNGNILCEGAQGVWLDVNHGDYPYVTSSETLPYAACSIGFPPQKISEVYGAAKIYDTRSGEDPRFPSSLLDDPELSKLGDLGQEYGVTTGRRRKVDWLDLDKLVDSINITGTTVLIVSKCDIIEQLGVFKVKYNDSVVALNTFQEMKDMINETVRRQCSILNEVVFSSSPEVTRDEQGRIIW